jgi:RimJ/RimL family protein N-acetyltransferase
VTATAFLASSVAPEPLPLVAEESPPIAEELEAAIDAQILHDIAPYYGELERGFAATHLPRIGAMLPSIGFSTTSKLGWPITDGERVVGKAVCTVKRGGSLKIGPIVVLPNHRNRGHATSFLQSIVQLAHACGRACVFATVPIPNHAAQRSFELASFRRAGTLGDHYRTGCSEAVMVYAAPPATRAAAGLPELAPKASRARSPAEHLRCYVAEQFFPVDASWNAWLACTAGSTLGAFEHKPHDLIEAGPDEVALVIYKRGGTAKVVPVIDSSEVPPDLIFACEQAAHRRARRKISIFLPSWVSGPSGYRCELEAFGYSLRGPIRVWSSELTP